MKPPFIRTAYNYDVDDVSRETSLVCDDESLAVQSERDECDINTIVRRFGLTGHIPVGVRMPSYGDFVGVSDYQTALHAIMEADEAFMAMPAEIRERFKNDPAAFVDFCADPANMDEARSLGLVPASQLGDPAGGTAGPGDDA